MNKTVAECKFALSSWEGVQVLLAQDLLGCTGPCLFIGTVCRYLLRSGARGVGSNFELLGRTGVGLKHKHLTTGEIGKPANYEFFFPSNMQEPTALQSPRCHTNDCHTIWELFILFCECVNNLYVVKQKNLS